MADPFELQRFLEAQAPTYVRALDEVRRGQKRSHWMWFVFPQFGGLGSSFMAQRYAIRSLEEARAYLAHPVDLRGPGKHQTRSGIEGECAALRQRAADSADLAPNGQTAR